MLVSLTRKQRKQAGWLAALVYLLCILAPTLSYALPGEHAVVDCMTIDGVSSGSTHMHDASMQSMHAHMDGGTQDHAPSPAMAMSDDESSSMAAATDGDEAPAKKGPHTTSGQCCALMCLAAMPAPMFDFAPPSMPTVVRIATSYRVAADNAPAVQYRPPIA